MQTIPADFGKLSSMSAVLMATAEGVRSCVVKKEMEEQKADFEPLA